MMNIVGRMKLPESFSVRVAGAEEEPEGLLTKSRRKWDMKEYVKHAGSLSDNVHGLRSSRRKALKSKACSRYRDWIESVEPHRALNARPHSHHSVQRKIDKMRNGGMATGNLSGIIHI